MDPPRYRTGFTKECTVCTKPELGLAIVLVVVVIVIAIIAAVFKKRSLTQLYQRVRYQREPLGNRILKFHRTQTVPLLNLTLCLTLALISTKYRS